MYNSTIILNPCLIQCDLDLDTLSDIKANVGVGLFRTLW